MPSAPKSGNDLHEPRERLSHEAQDRHRARVSLTEELEAVDWYDQRIEAAYDSDLKKILTHNRNEENEHAAMLVQWLRKRDPVLDAELAKQNGSGGEASNGAPSIGQGESNSAHLRRYDAPFATSVWQRLDEEAERALQTYLGARKLVDQDGPHGWERSAVSLGRVSRADAEPLDVPGLEIDLRQLQPLLELRVPFKVPRTEIEAIERGADDPDLRALVDACRKVAAAEARIVFYGYEDGDVRGLVDGSPHEPLSIGGDFTSYPSVIAEAIERLRSAGVAGPYGLALGPRLYDGLARTAGSGGYPVLEHVRRLLDGPTVWVPDLDDGVVLSTRGGDQRLVIGQDVTIGYRGHDATDVFLYAEESMTFRLLAPEAAVGLKNAG